MLGFAAISEVSICELQSSASPIPPPGSDEFYRPKSTQVTDSRLSSTQTLDSRFASTQVADQRRLQNNEQVQ